MSEEQDALDRVLDDEPVPDMPHVHGCKLPPDHAGGCVSDTPHKFGGNCQHCGK